MHENVFGRWLHDYLSVKEELKLNILPNIFGSTRKQVFSLDSELSKYLLIMYFFPFRFELTSWASTLKT